MKVAQFINPITAPGLSIHQRISYSASLYHWSVGIPKFIYYMAPPWMLFTGTFPIANYDSRFLAIYLTFLGALIVSYEVASRGRGRWRSGGAGGRGDRRQLRDVATVSHLHDVRLAVEADGIDAGASLGSSGCRFRFGLRICGAGHGLKGAGIAPVLEELQANLGKERIGQDVVDLALAAGLHGPVLVLAGITTPANVGMILRTATAAGFAGIVVPRRGVASIDPLVVKASAGVAFKAPILKVATTVDAVSALAAHGYRIAGLDAQGTTDLFSADLPRDTAYVMGGETAGLGAEVSELVDTWVSIPMAGDVESLNVSAAAAVLCFDVVRRGARRPSDPPGPARR